MKKASSLFVLIFFAIMISQVNAQVGPRHQEGHDHGQHGQGGSYGQGGYSQDQVLSERVNLPMRMRESRRLSELLRLSMSESRDLEVISITLLASAMRGQTQIDILSRGRPVGAPQVIRRQFSELTLLLPSQTKIEDLEIMTSDDITLDTITAQVRNSYNPLPLPGPGPSRDMQPMSGQLIRLDVREDIRYSGEIRLKQLVSQQLGLSLEGAQIERIAVQGMVMRGMSASVQVEMNNRIVSPAKIISMSQGMTPIPLNSLEEVRNSLSLVVQGDVVITQINIRLGQVRQIQSRPYPQPQPLPQRPIRFQVSQEISSGRPLEISALMPYENRLISTISLEARSSRVAQAEIALISMGQIVASTIVSQVPMRPVLQLLRPMSPRELKLQSLSPVLIDAIEVGFANYQVW